MTGAEFMALASNLTGTPVKGCSVREEKLLDSMLADESRAIDNSQFNELLLLVNKDRMEPPLYACLFGGNAAVGTITSAVQKFQTIAMLRYGNFVYAYRTLSRITAQEALSKELGSLPIGGPSLAKYQSRTAVLLQTGPIPRDDTPLVGYLSATTIAAESVRARLVLDTMQQASIEAWDDLIRAVSEMSKEKERPRILDLIHRYRNGHPESAPTGLREYLSKAVPLLEQRHQRLEEVQAIGAQNQETYLTWDHMDVYFATSMRKAWEYTDLHDFVAQLMLDPKLRQLNVRHFDPTQSYADQRIDKGLVESLMLKRAKCTVYSVQDTDTLGKDSELAATLAQGKPVIAYIPAIEVAKRTHDLLHEDPLTILDRLRFVLYADDALFSSLDASQVAVLENLGWLTEFERNRVFRTAQDETQTQSLRALHREDLEHLSRIVATSEQRIYDNRSRTLRERHPLGIQVNLDTGVANGVLVVRDAGTCADLLAHILTETMEFTIEEDEAAWYLRERISQSVFRVVTKNLKVSNCFWNFYLRS